MTALSPNSSDIVLLLGCFVGCFANGEGSNILDWPENRRYEYHPPANGKWKADQIDDIESIGPILCLHGRVNLFNPSGWVFGSEDSDECDVRLIDTNQTGVSRLAFRVDIAPKTHKPRLTALTKRPITIHESGGKVTIAADSTKYNKAHTLESSSWIQIGEEGAVKFRVWVPNRDEEELRKYADMARRWIKGSLDAIPKQVPKHSGPPTSLEEVRASKTATYITVKGAIVGRGAHASVMKVLNPATAEYFGAKEPYFKSNDGIDAIKLRHERLVEEFQNQERLEHPYIVQAVDIATSTDITLPPWMIIEYLPSTLYQELQKQNLSTQEQLMIMLQLISALHHMHEQGFAHRDVKPDNILLDREKTPLLIKLADFGTAKLSGSSKMNSFTGTEIYLAPELFPRPTYDYKVDMWALGVTSLQIFTDWDPDTDEIWNPSDFGSWIRLIVAPNIATADSRVQPLLKGLFRRDPGKRWSTASCLRWFHLQQSSSLGEMVRAWHLDSSVSGNRFLRSPNPSISTVWVATGKAGGSSLPDTQSFHSDIHSVASTPHIDDGSSEAEQADEDIDENVDLLQDWPALV